MGVNIDNPSMWKKDITTSVDFYNRWFLDFAPKAFQRARQEATAKVLGMLASSNDGLASWTEILRQDPSILPILRMVTAPPIASDRLSGLAGISKGFIKTMEKEGKLPPRASNARIDKCLNSISDVIDKLLDTDILSWIPEQRPPDIREKERAASVIADRATGASANPVIRNQQEKRQLTCISEWLDHRGYEQVSDKDRRSPLAYNPGSYAFHVLMTGEQEGGNSVNIPIDAVVMPMRAKSDQLPILVEAKSAGDFTNTNKRRKEEAAKVAQLRRKYGNDVEFILFLAGYFDTSYLGYEAGEGIDWVWEHRVDDLAKFGV
jgi:hypothetical protein